MAPVEDLFELMQIELPQIPKVFKRHEPAVLKTLSNQNQSRAIVVQSLQAIAPLSKKQVQVATVRIVLKFILNKMK